MWKTDPSKNEIGFATWRDGESAWSVDARGGNDGIRIIRGDIIADADRESAVEFARLDAVDSEQLPSIAEQFVRGKELHLWLPQNEGTFGIRLTLEPIRSRSDSLVLEATIAIQTDLLDSHPKLDIVVEADSIESASTAISVGTFQTRSTSVLLGRHDSPFTTGHSTDNEIRLRLFGDFLEKGVIRKARPWLVLGNGSDAPSKTDLEQLLDDLNGSPLPLTP